MVASLDWVSEIPRESSDLACAFCVLRLCNCVPNLGTLLTPKIWVLGIPKYLCVYCDS